MLSATIPAEQTIKTMSSNVFAFLKGTPTAMSSRNRRNKSAETAVEKRHSTLDIRLFPNFLASHKFQNDVASITKHRSERLKPSSC